MDIVVVEHGGAWLKYTITEHEVVTANNRTVLFPVPHQPETEPTRRLLTLTTCHSPTRGESGNSHRWITYAELTGWAPRGGSSDADGGAVVVPDEIAALNPDANPN